MVRRYEITQDANSIPDNELEQLLQKAVVKHGMTLTQFLAEAIKQQLVKNGVPSGDGNKNKKTERSELQAHLKSTRDSIEIIRDILNLGEVTKTRIKYEAGLDHRQVERYLNFLINGEFLEKVETKRRGAIYGPSEQGLKLLEKIDDLCAILEDARLKTST